MSAANPLLVASASDVVLSTTAATTVLSHAVSAGNFVLFLYVRILATTTLTVTVAWTDGTGAQVETVLRDTQQIGAFPVSPSYFAATDSTVSVIATAETANAAAVSASLKAL